MYKINIFVFFVTLGLGDAALRLDNEPELREARAKIFNSNSKAGWLLLNYVGPNTLHFAERGTGTVRDMIDFLEEDQIQYALIRVPVNEKGSTKTVFRDVFITYIGGFVTIFERGQKAKLLGDAQSFLRPYHAAITVVNRNNFTDKAVIDRSDPLSKSNVID